MKAENTTQQRDQAVRKRLIAALGITEEQMFWLEWKMGMQYLENQCMGNIQAVDVLKSEPFYWNWWIHYWRNRNELFIAEYAACKHVTWGIYTEFHKHLVLDEKLSQNYMYMMSSVTKTESRKLTKQFTKA